MCSDFGPPKIKYVTVSIVSPSICHEVIGPDARCLCFLNAEFQASISPGLEAGIRISTQRTRPNLLVSGIPSVETCLPSTALMRCLCIGAHWLAEVPWPWQGTLANSSEAPAASSEDASRKGQQKLLWQPGLQSSPGLSTFPSFYLAAIDRLPHEAVNGEDIISPQYISE